MSQREKVARWIYEYVTSWVAEMYDAQELAVTPWDHCPDSIQQSWYDKADELLAIVESSS